MDHLVRAAIAAGLTCLVAAGGAACGGGGEGQRTPAPPARALSASVCSPVTYGGPGRPSALIVNSGPFQGAVKAHGLQNAQAIKLILAQRGWRAGRRTLGVQICDESSASSGEPSERECARRARAIAADRSVLGVVGPQSSVCARAMLPILSRAPGGPVPAISMSATYLGLTRAGPGALPGDPGRLYPTGRRNFARVVPADDAQGAAAAVFARRLGVRRPFVLNDGEAFGEGVAGAFANAARRRGMTVAGTATWAPRASGYARLAERVQRARADGVYLGGQIMSNGPRLIHDLRGRLGPRAQIIGPDAFFVPAEIVEAAGEGAEGVTLTIATLPNRALPPAGRRFAAAFERRFSQRPCCYAVHAAQAAEIMLDAIAGSDGSRERVTANLFRTRVRDGLLGSFGIDRSGDTTLTTIAVYRIRGGQARFVAAITPSADLLARR